MTPRGRALAVLATLAWLVHSAAPAAGATLAATRLDELPQRWVGDDGREVVLSDLAGRRVVLTMAYAGCHKFCPMTIAGLQAMQKTLDARGEHADFVVVGYDPANENAADWRQYRRSRHLARPNWHFVSGSRDDTQQLAHQLGFEFWKYDEHVMHDSRVVVFDERGTLRVALGPETRRWPAAL